MSSCSGADTITIQARATSSSVLYAVRNDHQCQGSGYVPINGLASFVFKGLLSDSSHQDAHDGMCSHFDQLLTQPSKEPSNEGKGLNLTVVVGPNTNNICLNVTRTKTYLQQQHGNKQQHCRTFYLWP